MKVKRNELVKKLARQTLLGGDPVAAAEIAKRARVKTEPAGRQLLKQRDLGDDMLFLFSGEVEVLVNCRRVALRRANDSIGELAIADPEKKRSATIVTTKRTTFASVSARHVADVADRHPAIWKRLAREVTRRLRQRNHELPPADDQLRVFISSSTESLAVANAVSEALRDGGFFPLQWDNFVFRASKCPMEDLEDVAKSADFAVIVLGPDDRIESRQERISAPRDNVLMEAGLFLAALGRDRTAMLKPVDVPVKIPSNLGGLCVLDYRHKAAARREGLTAALDKLTRKFEATGRRAR